MNSIDEDARLLGIDPKIWSEFKEMYTSWKDERMTQYKERELPSVRELPLKRELPPERLMQGEFESITGPIDDREAFIRRKQALAKRWFGYYKKCKGDRNRIIDQYNKIALMKGNER